MRRVLIRLAPLGCLLGVLVLAYAMGWHRNLTLQALVENNGAIDAFIAAHRIAAILSFVVIYAIGAILAMPARCCAGGGWRLPVRGTHRRRRRHDRLDLGATAVFLIARSAFGELLLRRLGPRVESFAAGFRADAFCYVMFLRLMPVPSWFTTSPLRCSRCGCAPSWARPRSAASPAASCSPCFGAGLDSMIATQEVAYRACLAAGELDCRIDFDPANVVTPTLIAALAVSACWHLRPS
jgi:hypothetical protein